ncbi:hypothetical protein T265_00743 [Opisthorchis viverrini]|uniref:Uncharacterized protein n=1 Tax=Opisthorchis viverrini TaxID=6198 RepID=A0A075A243_OPIVI|nr:hypothetical protein T265_00743 [Opisthorchis viverrini]KER33436.1 hypothetical protein T265_00743 [Opisthorchis viverrini]
MLRPLLVAHQPLMEDRKEVLYGSKDKCDKRNRRIFARRTTGRSNTGAVDDMRHSLLARWREHEFTDRKVRGSNPASASRLRLSKLEQPDSIPALVQPLGGMAVRHRKGATAERFLLPSKHHRTFPKRTIRNTSFETKLITLYILGFIQSDEAMMKY